MTNFRFSRFPDILKAMGLVFGDIGTSPIYTLAVIFTITAPTQENVLGILSLIFWTLIILVTVGYWWLAMSLSIKGEGGIIVLKEIVAGFLKEGRKMQVAAILGYVGISLLMGDGVITPAISILSAVEGIPLIPGLQNISHGVIMIITIIITIVLFMFQYKGTDKVASSFGPIMLLWFAALALTGISSIIRHPYIFSAVSPYYAIEFMTTHGFVGFLVLSEVILCATGGEALYADMGHLGAKPIRSAWVFVFFALFMNYFGQGAFLMDYPNTKLILFGMVKQESGFFYIPFVILTILATVIASQAMISAVFSLVYQGITTRIFPLLKIKYTSSELKSQIYIGAVNWGLMTAVIFMILLFKESAALAAAYGLAVTITMTLSAIFMLWIFRHARLWVKFSFALVVLLVDLGFLFSLFSKLPHGGYWSLIIASIPFFTMLIWIRGQQIVHRSFRSLPLDVYLLSFQQIYATGRRLEGTALFFTRSLQDIPPYMFHTTLSSSIIYDNNMLVSVQRTDQPYGIESEYVEFLTEGLSGLVIRAGYQEFLDISKILEEKGITEKVIFYGMEDIVTEKFFLKLYSFLKKLSPNFVQFYKLPYSKIHGVISRLEI